MFGPDPSATVVDKCETCGAEMRRMVFQDKRLHCHECKKRAEEKMGNWYGKVRRGLIR